MGVDILITAHDQRTHHC